MKQNPFLTKESLEIRANLVGTSTCRIQAITAQIESAKAERKAARLMHIRSAYSSHIKFLMQTNS